MRGNLSDLRWFYKGFIKCVAYKSRLTVNGLDVSVKYFVDNMLGRQEAYLTHTHNTQSAIPVEKMQSCVYASGVMWLPSMTAPQEV